jgi:hypothetical protein
MRIQSSRQKQKQKEKNTTHLPPPCGLKLPVGPTDVVTYVVECPPTCVVTVDVIVVQSVVDSGSLGEVGKRGCDVVIGSAVGEVVRGLEGVDERESVGLMGATGGVVAVAV